VDEIYRHLGPDFDADCKQILRATITFASALEQSTIIDALLCRELTFAESRMAGGTSRQDGGRGFRFGAANIPTGANGTVQVAAQVPAQDARLSMKAVEKATFDHSGGSEASSQRDQDQVFAPDAGAPAPLAEQCEAGVIFYDER
jgi:hypothetical protein